MMWKSTYKLENWAESYTVSAAGPALLSCIETIQISSGVPGELKNNLRKWVTWEHRTRSTITWWLRVGPNVRAA